MEIVLFFSFLAILLAKWILYPHVAVRRALSDPDELGTYAIPPIALITIGALTITQVSEGPWGGHAFTLVGYVIWWIGVVWVFVTCVVVLTVLFYTGNQADRDMTPVLFMAPVGMATAASEAGLITIYGFDMSSRLAVPQIIVGYFASGVAMFMAILLYTVYFHRLLAAGTGFVYGLSHIQSFGMCSNGISGDCLLRQSGFYSEGRGQWVFDLWQVAVGD